MDLEKITLGSGCFWCTEAVFQYLIGVISVESGYMGGTLDGPTYMQVCNGNTGHAEVVNLVYNADEITFNDLLLAFFKTHKPTTLNRQGADVGTHYRSVIFYHTDAQKQQAEAMVKLLTDEQVFDKPIVTEISPATTFYKAEYHHQNYYMDNHMKQYCLFVIQPKLNKFAKEFTAKIKPELL